MNIPEKHRAVAHAWVDGARVEGRDTKAIHHGLNEWEICWFPSWLEDWEYRIKLTKPSINWEHISPEYVALATDNNGNSYLYMGIPEATAHMWESVHPCTVAEVFQSFVKGTCDWKDSLVVRPSAVSEKVAAPLPTTAHDKARNKE